METGLVGAIGTLLLAGAAVAQPLDVVAGQSPDKAIGTQVSQELTGSQSTELPRIVLEDFIAEHDSVAQVIRLHAFSASNVYGLRVRLIELDQLGNEIAELAVVVGGETRLAVDVSGVGVTTYEIELEGPVGLRVGTRYGIEATGLLSSPAMGEKVRSWRWLGAQGDGSVFADEGQGRVRVSHPGLAFEVLGEILTPPCLADVNGDGTLTPADFNAWILAYNQLDPKADQNGDGSIAPNDFNAWILNYNAGC